LRKENLKKKNSFDDKAKGIERKSK
jgi:hypothetical protein